MNDRTDTAAAAGQFTVNRGGFRLELSFTADAGRILVLFGPSGAGKTTALRTIAGLAQPDAGRITIAGRTVFAKPDDAPGQPVWVPPHRRGVGYVTQQNHLFPHLTVSQNIGYGLSRRRGASAQRRVAALIDRLRLHGLEERRVWQLSGGQQQRAALARALAPSPDLLLLDEPFAALDMELRRELGAELRSTIRQLNVPVILVTHSREEALALGDTVQDDGSGRAPDGAGAARTGRVARLVGVETCWRCGWRPGLPQDGTMVCVSNAGGARAAGQSLETPLGRRLGSGRCV